MIKKVVLLFLFIFTILFSIQRSNAATFEEAMSQSKPIALIVYADWADDSQSMLGIFNQLEQLYGSSYNFVKINIAKPETKAYNQRFYIYPNLPYVMLFRDKGRISRYIQKDCALNSSCIKDKMDIFNI